MSAARLSGDCQVPEVPFDTQEEEEAEAASKSTKRKRKKPRKKAAKAAAVTADSLQQSLPTEGSSTADAAGGQRSANKDAALSGGADQLSRPPSGLDADAGAEAPAHTGSEVDDSWQLCPLSKVGKAPVGRPHGTMADWPEVCCPVWSLRTTSPSLGVLQVRMRDPVIASDGVCYDRSALEGWVEEHGAVSPTTREAIGAHYIPNHTLRSLLQTLQQPS
jgi:U-box domain